jgi:hypothetical protein
VIGVIRGGGGRDGSKLCDNGVESMSRSTNVLLFSLFKTVCQSYSDSGAGRTAVGLVRTGTLSVSHFSIQIIV